MLGDFEVWFFLGGGHNNGVCGEGATIPAQFWPFLGHSEGIFLDLFCYYFLGGGSNLWTEGHQHALCARSQQQLIFIQQTEGGRPQRCQQAAP